MSGVRGGESGPSGEFRKGLPRITTWHRALRRLPDPSRVALDALIIKARGDRSVKRKGPSASSAKWGIGRLECEEGNATSAPFFGARSLRRDVLPFSLNTDMGVLLFLLRFPLPRQTLRLGNLGGGHLGRKEIPVAQCIITFICICHP